MIETELLDSVFNNIGYLYDSMGQYKKALGYYEQALVIQEKILDKKHPSTVTFYNNIGGVYHN